MSHGSRHRWLRRIALGLAFASLMFARTSIAVAGESALQQAEQTPYMSLGLDIYGDSRELPEPFVARPDDVADHVSHSDVAQQVKPANGDNWRLEWTDALPLGIGIIVLAVAVALALGQLRRFRLAGLEVTRAGTPVRVDRG